MYEATHTDIHVCLQLQLHVSFIIPKAKQLSCQSTVIISHCTVKQRERCPIIGYDCMPGCQPIPLEWVLTT